MGRFNLTTFLWFLVWILCVFFCLFLFLVYFVRKVYKICKYTFLTTIYLDLGFLFLNFVCLFFFSLNLCVYFLKITNRFLDVFLLLLLFGALICGFKKISLFFWCDDFVVVVLYFGYYWWPKIICFCFGIFCFIENFTVFYFYFFA